jgi:GDP-D-mannose dehydratase
MNKNYEGYIVIQDGFIPEHDTLVSNSSVRTKLGWKPKVDFHQLADMVMVKK